MPGSGLQGQIGTAEETAYGTPVTVDRFYEFLSEDLERRNRILQSNGIRATTTRNLRRGSRRVVSARDGGGTIRMEVATTGFSRWFRHMLGGTPTVVQQNPPLGTAWLHTHQLGNLDGRSLTIQKGAPQTDGTVKPFTLHGCKITQWELSIGVDQILLLAVTVDAEDVDTSTALAAASFGPTKLFHFAQGTLKVAGTAVASVLNATVQGNNNLKVDRYYLGSQGLKREPIDNDFPTIEGTLTAEFVSQATFYDRFAADTPAELVLEFEGDVIEGTHRETCRVTVPEVRFTGDTPKIAGPDVLVQNVPFEGGYDGTNPGVRIEYKTTDSAV